MANAQANTMNDDRLTEIFKEACEPYNIDSVRAEFTVFKDFKVQWSRSHSWISFRVSDYLQDAPSEAIKGLANTLVARIFGEAEVPYSQAMREWVLAPEFSKEHRTTYVRRSRSLHYGDLGEVYNLDESIARLEKAGLLEPGHGIQCYWNEMPNKAASSSVLFRVVAVSDRLDDKDVDPMVLDYAVYTQCLRIIEGAKVFGYTTEVNTREQERLFDGYEEAEKELNRMGLLLF